MNMVQKANNEKGKANKKRSTAPREKEILLPPKDGTVSRSLIRKAVREIIKERSAAQ
jgi:hypothetical protein